jgi:hypothetical protein
MIGLCSTPRSWPSGSPSSSSGSRRPCRPRSRGALPAATRHPAVAAAQPDDLDHSRAVSADAPHPDIIVETGRVVEPLRHRERTLALLPLPIWPPASNDPGGAEVKP